LKKLLNNERKAELKDWLWGRQLPDMLQEFPVECSANELLETIRPPNLTSPPPKKIQTPFLCTNRSNPNFFVTSLFVAFSIKK